MHPYWECLIHPLLKQIQPRCLIEIGCEAGKTTKLLLEYCEEHHAVLHGIDPSPRFDVAEWKSRYGSRLIFHRTASLQALPLIDGFDVVLIDGDHNWYTVYHELNLIAKQSASLPASFPIVLLHDVGWPYGRRDLYYNPDSIPDEFRHPFEKKGIHPDSNKLLVEGGINRGLCNAVHENGPRNGVLTAVDDFQSRFLPLLEFILIPGFHGLGILFPAKLKNSIPGLETLLESWNLPEGQARYLQQLEEARLRLSGRVLKNNQK